MDGDEYGRFENWFLIAISSCYWLNDWFVDDKWILRIDQISKSIRPEQMMP